MRKHRLAECLLVDVIGLDYADVHEEACRWEHVMSEAVERKLLTLLGNPTVSPFGNPIPGLDALRGDAAGRRRRDLRRARLAHPAVHDGHRRGPAGRHPADQRAAAGERRPAARCSPSRASGPGATMTARLVEGSVSLDGQPLPAGVAQHVFVSAVDEELTPLEAAAACG